MSLRDHHEILIEILTKVEVTVFDKVQMLCLFQIVLWEMIPGMEKDFSQINGKILVTSLAQAHGSPRNQKPCKALDLGLLRIRLYCSFTKENFSRCFTGTGSHSYWILWQIRFCYFWKNTPLRSNWINAIVVLKGTLLTQHRVSLG